MTRISLFAPCAVCMVLLTTCSEPVQHASDKVLHVAGGKKKVVPDTEDTTSACTALYSSASARATVSNAVIDPAVTYGTTGTLILSFNDEDALAPAEMAIISLLDQIPMDGMSRVENLAMLTISAPLTQDLIDALQANLQGYGLLSIYQDRPLQYFLDRSADYIGAPAAREDFQVTGAGIGVAVIDTGVDGLQGDFANLVQNIKILGPIGGFGAGGYLYLDNQANTDLTSGHGTHVAGTIGGSGAQSNGKYTGIAPGASLVGIGAGDGISILYALQGFDYSLDPDNRDAYNLRVISNSWGSSGDFAPFNPINIASKRAYDLGMIVAFAAGNSGPDQDTLNPYSASPCVLSVAAGDKDGNLANFSSRGIPDDTVYHPDITAPGVHIIAPRATTGAVTPPYTGDLEYGAFYSRISGTSMATPHISGVVALMLQANPNLNLDSVLEVFAATASPMYDPGNVERPLWEVGHGYVNAYAAVQQAIARGGTRYVVETSPLDAWSGTVDLAVSIPLGEALIAAEDNRILNVPESVTALRVVTSWENPALDLDLYVYGPDGSLIASSAQGASTSEAVSIPNPVAGTYRVQLQGYLNTPTSYTGAAEVDRRVALP